MTSLKLLERKFARENPERIPAPEPSGLGAAIEQMIADAVQQQVANALEQRKPPAPVRRLMDEFNKPTPVTDYRELKPVATTPAPKIRQISVERDGAGKARFMMVDGDHGSVRMKIEYDGAGRVVRMVPDDLAAEVTYDGKPVPPPNKGE